MLTPTQVALNHTPVTVTKKDGSTELISIAQLDIEGLYIYLDAFALGQMPKVIAHACNKDIAWVNTLALSSVGKLAQIITDQNFLQAMEIVAADPIAAVKCAPALAAVTAGHAALATTSPALLRVPASLESQAASGSGSSDSPQAASST